MKLLNNYFQTCILVADIKPEILRYLRPPTDVIFRYLTETHPEAISAESSLYTVHTLYNCSSVYNCTNNWYHPLHKLRGAFVLCYRFIAKPPTRPWTPRRRGSRAVAESRPPCSQVLTSTNHVTIYLCGNPGIYQRQCHYPDMMDRQGGTADLLRSVHAELT